MGTKANPSQYDCYALAMPDEPTFTLSARDPDFAATITDWTLRRMQRVARGERPFADVVQVIEALEVADQGADWREANNGKWRRAGEESAG